MGDRSNRLGAGIKPGDRDKAKLMLEKGKKKGLIDDDVDWADGPMSERGGYRGKEFDALSLSDNSEFPPHINK